MREVLGLLISSFAVYGNAEVSRVLAPELEVQMRVVSFDDKHINGYLMDGKKIRLSRSAIKNPTVDGKFHKYTMSITSWRQAEYENQ